MKMWPGIIERYREYLSVSDATPVITLNEGNTPLVKADNLARLINPELEIYRTEDEVPIPLGAPADWRRVEPEEDE